MYNDPSCVCKIMCITDWNIYYWWWWKRCPKLVGPTLKKTNNKNNKTTFNLKIFKTCLVAQFFYNNSTLDLHCCGQFASLFKSDKNFLWFCQMPFCPVGVGSENERLNHKYFLCFSLLCSWFCLLCLSTCMVVCF